MAHTWALQPTARRFGSVTVSVPVTSSARLTKSGSFVALRTRLHCKRHAGHLLGYAAFFCWALAQAAGVRVWI